MSRAPRGPVGVPEEASVFDYFPAGLKWLENVGFFHGFGPFRVRNGRLSWRCRPFEALFEWSLEVGELEQEDRELRHPQRCRGARPHRAHVRYGQERPLRGLIHLD